MTSGIRKLPRRLLALLVALSLFAPASGFGQVLYSCMMSGKVSRGGCCCHRARLHDAAQEHARGLRPAAKAERPECCRAEPQRGTAAPSALDDASTKVQTAALVGLLPVELPDSLAAERVSVLARSCRGPPRDLALFARNCALLI